MLTTKRVVIHVGLMKTGTTSLQMDVLSQLPDVHYVGQPLDRLFQNVGRFFSAIQRNDAPTWEQGLPDFIAQYASLFHTDRSTIVISDEHLSCGQMGATASPDTIADRLKQLFPRAEILLVVRNQLTALPSLYAYAMAIGPARHQSFDAWLGDLLHDTGTQGLGLFDHEGHLERYAQRFGTHRVKTLLYEDLQADPGLFLRQLSEHVGSSLAEPERLPLRRHNARPTRRKITAKRLQAAAPWLSGLAGRMPRAARQGWNRFLERGPKPDTTWTAQTQERISAFYRTGNAALGAQLDRDLQSLGYPLP